MLQFALSVPLSTQRYISGNGELLENSEKNPGGNLQ